MMRVTWNMCHLKRRRTDVVAQGILVLTSVMSSFGPGFGKTPCRGVDATKCWRSPPLAADSERRTTQDSGEDRISVIDGSSDVSSYGT